MEIKNNKLKQLDKKVGDFYRLSHRYLGSLSNLYGREVYKRELADVLYEADQITPESTFDDLILKNIQSNLRLNDLTLDYLSDPNFSLDVQSFFDKIAGDGAFQLLEDKVRSPPWKNRWEMSEKTQERDYTRVSPFTEEAQKAAKAWVPQIKEDILKYGKSEGLLPEDFKMNILLLPPKDGSESSNWNSVTKLFSLGSYGFDFFHKNAEVVAIPTRAYNVAFHEVLGHGAHQINSQNMPFSCKFTEEVGAMTPTKSITEGVAMNAEKECYKFLRDRMNNLRITEEDINLLQEGMELENQTMNEYMYYALLKDKELKEKDFDGYKHLLNLTKNPVMARAFKENFKGTFEDLWKHTGHTLGPLHYEKMRQKVENTFGKEYLDNNRKKFHKATLTGVWSWEIYPDAVTYFMKNN